MMKRNSLNIVLMIALTATFVTALQADKGDKAKDGSLAAKGGLVYELRTYTTAEGRLPALHKRFRDHTMAIFEKHGMKNVMYWTPVDKPNTLIYVIAHASRDAAKKSWNGFRNDPAWKKAYKASVADGKIVTKVESVYMSPTDYSPMNVSFKSSTSRKPR